MALLVGVAGPLALAALADGRFARFLLRRADAVRVSLDEARRLTEGEVLALARYAWEARPEVFERLAQALKSKLTSERFDVISSAPNFPSVTGSGGLYSRDFFEVARERLAPGGTMSQFAPVWRMRAEDVKTIAGSFADVFPHVRVFSTGVSLVMLGRMEPFPPVDMDEVARRVADPQVMESLERIGVRGPVELLSFFQMDEAALKRWAAEAPRNTDDRPRTEFFAPRAVFDATVAPNLAEIRTFRASAEDRAKALGLTGEWTQAATSPKPRTTHRRMSRSPVARYRASVPAASLSRLSERASS